MAEKCPACGIVVEKVPWASGKHGLCDGFRLYLAHWARKLSWEEVAGSFGVSWADVYTSIQWVVDYGLKHRTLENIKAIGVDEICVQVGRVFWVLIYQIDARKGTQQARGSAVINTHRQHSTILARRITLEGHRPFGHRRICQIGLREHHQRPICPPGGFIHR